MAVNPNLIPERTGVNSLGTPTEPWERLNAENLNEIPVDDIATTADTEKGLYNLIPTPIPVVDDGKIPRVKNGSYVLTAYPKNALPPTSSEDSGKLLRIGLDGEPHLEDCSNLPETTGFDEGATIRVIGGQLQVRRGNAHGDLNPTPVAPVSDGFTLVSEGEQWVLKAVDQQYIMPPIGPDDIGKFVVLWREEETGPVQIKYIDPPLATGTSIGAIPALSGNANQFLGGDLQWHLVNAGNSGHWRLGDIKRTIRPAAPPFIKCEGSVGSQPSGATYYGDEYKPLYAMLDGTADWLDHWNDNTRQNLPSLAWCQICYLPDAQAPAPFAPVFDAEYAGGANSFFAIELSTTLDDWSSAIKYDSANNIGFWRLGGSLPMPVQTTGDSYPIDGESIMFDASEVFSDLTIGLWYYRVRQLTGATFAGATPLAWQYGTTIVSGE